MKIIISLLCFLIFLNSCSNNTNNNNPYLPNYNFSVEFNLSLPAYSSLKYPSNVIYSASQGVHGIFVFNTGSGYVSFDAACPNQSATSCAAMTIKGVNAICSCDKKEYSFFTGQSSAGGYPMKSYRVDVQGDVIRVYN